MVERTHGWMNPLSPGTRSLGEASRDVHGDGAFCLWHDRLAGGGATGTGSKPDSDNAPASATRHYVLDATAGSFPSMFMNALLNIGLSAGYPYFSVRYILACVLLCVDFHHPARRLPWPPLSFAVSL
jgi:hypothetical protein